MSIFAWGNGFQRVPVRPSKTFLLGFADGQPGAGPGPAASGSGVTFCTRTSASVLRWLCFATFRLRGRASQPGVGGRNLPTGRLIWGVWSWPPESRSLGLRS